MTGPPVTVAESLVPLVRACKRRISQLKQAISEQEKLISCTSTSRRRFHEELQLDLFPQSLAEDTSIVIELTNLSGQLLQIKAGSSLRSVHDVKLEVAAHWNVPIVCQTLLVGSEVLEDDMPLIDLCKDCTTIPMTLVVSLENAYSSLTHGSRSDRQDALQALVKLDPKDRKSLRFAQSLVSDGAWEVRMAALDAIQQMSDKGDENSVSTVRKLLDDANARVRLCALHTLTQLAPSSGRCIAGAVHTLLQDRSEIVRDGVVQAFSTLPAATRDHIRSETRRLLLHSRAEVRISALRALSSLVQGSDASSVDAVCACLDNRDDTVRQEGLQALSHIAPRGDLLAIDAVAVHLKDPSKEVRLAALHAFAQVGNLGNERVITGVSSLLEDLDDIVRRSAIRIFADIASEDDELTVVAIIARLHHKHPKVRLAALEALLRVASSGNARALSAVSELFVDCNQHVRQKARQVHVQLLSKEPRRIKLARLPLTSPRLDVNCNDSDLWSIESQTDDEDDVLFVGWNDGVSDHQHANRT